MLEKEEPIFPDILNVANRVKILTKPEKSIVSTNNKKTYNAILSALIKKILDKNNPIGLENNFSGLKMIDRKGIRVDMVSISNNAPKSINKNKKYKDLLFDFGILMNSLFIKTNDVKVSFLLKL